MIKLTDLLSEKIKPKQKISKKEWSKIKKFNKHIGQDGTHYVTQLDKKLGTILVPVIVEEKLSEGISVADTRFVGKFVIHILSSGSEMRSAILSKRNSVKYATKSQQDVNTLWDLAGKYKGKEIKEGKLTEEVQGWVVGLTDGSVISGDKAVSEKKAHQIMSRISKNSDGWVNPFMIGVEAWNGTHKKSKGKPHKANKKKIMVKEGKYDRELISLDNSTAKEFGSWKSEVLKLSKNLPNSEKKKVHKDIMTINKLVFNITKTFDKNLDEGKLQEVDSKHFLDMVEDEIDSLKGQIAYSQDALKQKGIEDWEKKEYKAVLKDAQRRLKDKIAHHKKLQKMK